MTARKLTAIKRRDRIKLENYSSVINTTSDNSGRPMLPHDRSPETRITIGRCSYSSPEIGKKTSRNTALRGPRRGEITKRAPRQRRSKTRNRIKNTYRKSYLDSNVIQILNPEESFPKGNQ
jgi:hypothetical protein